MKTYKQKDLGYKRISTKAMYNVKMEDGSIWQVPAQIIADSRDEYYKNEKEDTIKYIKNGELVEYDLIDWAQNNMSWIHVSEYAEKVESSKCIDFQEGWINGENEIVGEI